MKDARKYPVIKRAVIDLVVEEGFYGTSMSKIAKRAGISQSTIYVYFKNKDEMINEIYLASKIDLAEYLFKELTPLEMEVEKFLKEIWRRIFQYILKNPNIFCFLEQLENSPHVNNVKSREILETHFSPILEVVDRAKAEGKIKNMPREILRSFVVAPISNIVQLHIKGIIKLDEELLEKTLDMIWDATKV